MPEPLAPPVSTAVPPTAPTATPPTPPRNLLLDAVVSLLVVAVCVWKRNHFLDISDNGLLALSLFFPAANLVAAGLSLRAYGLRIAALEYRMAFGALLTLYYGYLLLHVTGLSESPLGTLLVNAAGSSEHVKLYTGLGLGALLLQTFLATDACQRTAAALKPAPVAVAPVETPPVLVLTNRDASTVPY